jgi:putative NADH-flavin reductase
VSEALRLLRNENVPHGNMTGLSEMIAPGQQTGNSCLATINLELMVKDDGRSEDLRKDHAAVMICEFEKLAHLRRRFTEGYS